MTNEFEIHSSLNCFYQVFQSNTGTNAQFWCRLKRFQQTFFWFEMNVLHNYKKKMFEIHFVCGLGQFIPIRCHRPIAMIHKFNEHLNLTPNLLKSSSSLDRDAVYTFHRCQLSEQSATQIQSHTYRWRELVMRSLLFRQP